MWVWGVYHQILGAMIGMCALASRLRVVSAVSGRRTLNAGLPVTDMSMVNPELHLEMDPVPSEHISFKGMTGAEIFHEQMRRHGVDLVFGYPGGAILPVYDAIHNSPHFKFVLPRHEQGGGFMAQGYARVTGKPGIVLVTSGPGATNVITPLQDALMDGTPMIVFTGQVPTTAIGTDAFQEADVVGITRSCTKWNCLVHDIRDLPRRINEAFHIATTGRPGPVLLDLPKDVTAGLLTEDIDPTRRVGARKARIHSHNEADLTGQIQNAASRINASRRPVIYAGQGVIQAGACDLLRNLAAKANIPVTTTLQGMGGFDEVSPLSLHMLGMHGSAYANYAMQNADMILAVGARFDDRVTGNPAYFAPATRGPGQTGHGGIIHFEISPKNINKAIRSDLAVAGDLNKSLQALSPLLHYDPRDEWHQTIQGWKSMHPFTYGDKYDGADEPKPQQIIEELYEQVKHRIEDVIVTTGVGQHQMWAAQFYRWRVPRSFITSGGSGSMGFGLPAAIGAQLAAPGKVVVDIDGDASFSMTCQELLTAREYNIPVKILILNNRTQGMVRQWQDLFYDKRYSATNMDNPSFKSLAMGMGVKGIRCEHASDLKGAMAEFLAYNDGPVVLDAVCSKDEHVYPMVPSGKPLDQMVLAPPA